MREARARGPFTATIRGIVALDAAWGLVAFTIVLATVKLLNGSSGVEDALAQGIDERCGVVALGVRLGVPMAYLTGRVVGSGSDYLAVFRVAGTTAFMSYGLANIVDSIWKAQSSGTTFRHVFDGLVYSLLTAGVFGWLWP